MYRILRKISGQTRGGAKSLKRLEDFVTCIMTWKAYKLSVAKEIARLI